jgi:CRISPR-associated protein Cas5t
MITAFQPTLPVPPLSTINGLISAAIGRFFVMTTEKIGYFFSSKGKHTDLETIYQMGKGLTGIKSNVIKREFLYDNHLYLYTDDETIATAFDKPYFQLLLGRSSDLASVNRIDVIDKPTSTTLSKLKGTIVPFQPYHLPAAVQALPVCFSNDLPRRNIGTRPYSVLSDDYPDLGDNGIDAQGFRDDITLDSKKITIDVYWQEF